jgi:hypothetical protein
MKLFAFISAWDVVGLPTLRLARALAACTCYLDFVGFFCRVPVTHHCTWFGMGTPSALLPCAYLLCSVRCGHQGGGADAAAARAAWLPASDVHAAILTATSFCLFVRGTDELFFSPSSTVLYFRSITISLWSLCCLTVALFILR